MGQYKVLELQCPCQSARETPAPVTVTVLPTPPSTTHVTPPVVRESKVLCSSHQMTVEIPTGAISAVYVKGLCINMLGIQYVQGHIWLPSVLHELNFNDVEQGPCWCSVEPGGGGENIGCGFCFDWATFHYTVSYHVANSNCVICSLNKDAYVSVCAFIDIKGNQIKFQDVPKDCGYSVTRNKQDEG